jgi:hypothetical protein
MGLVEASEKDKGIQLSFKDNMDIPDWVKGYIYHAAEANLIKGYTDGTFRHDNLATRAEAVTMISNALSTMNEGIDTSYKVLVQGKELSLNTPVQVINDIAYVPVREIIQAAIGMVRFNIYHILKIATYLTEKFLIFSHDSDKPSYVILSISEGSHHC